MVNSHAPTEDDKSIACPYCLNIFQVKAEDCSRTVCNRCHNFFNACCGTKRTILAHGNHKHRPKCRFFDKNSKVITGEEKEDFYVKCLECIKADMPCEPTLDFEEEDIRLPQRSEVEAAYL